MASRGTGRLGAFTHVDLLVTAGALVLVVALLLPTLRDASERERVTRCVSNVHGLMRGTSAYLADYAGEFPFVTQTDGGFGICTWSYGGQTNDDYWRTDSGGAFYIQATARPLNPYLLGALVQPDRMNGSQVVARTPMPMVQCPSDRYSHQRAFEGGAIANLSCYNDVGTSYQYSLHGLTGTNVDLWGPSGNPGWNWLVVNRVLIRDVLAKHSSVYTLYLEDPLDWGLPKSDSGQSIGTLEIGNHGQLGKHSAGYLDGHGDYIYRDSRRWCGVGWAAIVPSWRYTGSTSPPIYYTINGGSRKNCDP